jgi:hypothetical protein
MWLDKALAALLVLGAIGHTMGSIQFYSDQPHARFWAVCTSVLIVVVAAMNWLRADRPLDSGLAWVTAAATLSYAAISFGFGFLVGNPMDWRALSFGAVSLALFLLSVRTALR